MKIGRNDSCPCGSGKKYKKCCLDRLMMYTLRVQHRQHENFYCTVDLSGDETLDRLHIAIQEALCWDNDHMYAFHLDNKWPRSAREYKANPLGEGNTDVLLRRLDLSTGSKFLYWFDFGDDHLFDVEVVAESAIDIAGAGSPKIMRFGNPPEQYADWDRVIPTEGAEPSDSQCSAG